MFWKSKGLVHQSTAKAEAELLLLNPRFNYEIEILLQNPIIYFSQEADNNTLAPLFKINKLIKIGTTIPVWQSQGTAPDLHATLKRCVFTNKEAEFTNKTFHVLSIAKHTIPTVCLLF